jgi:hypothetical protein
MKQVEHVMAAPSNHERAKASAPYLCVKKSIRYPSLAWFDGAHHDIPSGSPLE